MYLKPIDANLYESCLEKYPFQNYEQSIYVANKLIDEGYAIEYLGYFNQEECLACCMIATLPIMKVFKSAWIPKGMVIDYTDKALLQSFTRALKSYLYDLKVIYLEIDPMIYSQQRDKDGTVVPNGLNNFEMIDNLISCGFEKQEDSSHFISGIDLTYRTSDEIYEEFSNSTCQNIQMAKAMGIKVKEISNEDVNWEEVEHMNRFFNNQIHVLVSYKVDEDTQQEIYLDYFCFIEYGKEIVYIASKNNDFYSKYAIHWYMIQQAIHSGYYFYSFNELNPVFQQGKDGYDDFDFTRGFNAVVYELMGNYILPVNRSLYSMYKK